MKTATDLVKSIQVNAANFQHIAGTGKISGQLFADLVNAIEKVQRKSHNKALKRAAKKAKVEVIYPTPAYRKFRYKVSKKSILKLRK